MDREAAFMELVHEMRQKQRAYFRTRSRGHMAASMVLEKEVDKWLSQRYPDPPSQMLPWPEGESSEDW